MNRTRSAPLRRRNPSLASFLLIGAAVTALGALALGTPSAGWAFGKKSDICGSWNNYCEPPRAPSPRSAPSYRRNYGTPGYTSPRYAPAPTVRPGVAEWQTGKNLYNAGRYAEALPWFQRAANLDPNNWIPWDWIGSCLGKLERYHEAIEAFHRAIRLGSPAADVYGKLGWAYHRIRNYDQSLAYSRQALSMNLSPPNRATVLRNIALAEQEKSQRDATARAEMQRREAALRTEAARREQARRATEYERERQQREARYQAERDASSKPYTREGNLARAAIWREYLARYPNDLAAAQAYASALFGSLPQGTKLTPVEATAALAAAKRAIQLNPNSKDGYELAARLLVRIGRAEEAVQYLAAFAQRTNDKPLIATTATNLAQDAMREGKLGAAERMLEIAARTGDAEKVKPVYVQLRAMQFRAAVEGRNMNAATAAMRTLMRLEPDAPRRATSLGEALLRAGKIEEGKIAFTAAIGALPPEKRLAAVGQFRSAILAHTKDAAAYVEVQRAYIKLMPPGPSAEKAIEQARLGYVLHRLGRRAEALAEFEQAKALAGRNPDVLVRLGNAASQNLGEHAVAIRFYQDALKINPGDPQARAGLTAAQERLKFPAHKTGRTPGTEAPPGPAKADKPGAFGEADKAWQTGQAGAAKLAESPAAAAAEAGRVFDRGIVRAPGKPEPVKLQGMPKPPPPPSAKLRKDEVWQAFEKKEKEVEGRWSDAERKASETARRLEQAPPDKKGALQVELVKQRQEASKIKAELDKVRVDKESYRVNFDEKPTADGDKAKPGETKTDDTAKGEVSPDRQE